VSANYGCQTDTRLPQNPLLENFKRAQIFALLSVNFSFGGNHHKIIQKALDTVPLTVETIVKDGMLVQQQSVHSLDLTDLDLDKDEPDNKPKTTEKPKDEETKIQEEDRADGEGNLFVSEFDEYLDLLEIF
jgi:hypothetical protein